VAFVKNTRFLKGISRETEAFIYYYEDFIKITRLFEDIPREIGDSV
jgi:hypothetical protein